MEELDMIADQAQIILDTVANMKSKGATKEDLVILDNARKIIEAGVEFLNGSRIWLTTEIEQ